MKAAPNERGFCAAKFSDLYGSECSIQDSSLASQDAIWIGVNKDFEGRECTRMHLNREQVADLLPLLQRFVDVGSIIDVGGLAERKPVDTTRGEAPGFPPQHAGIDGGPDLGAS